jgi:hypothetical protein
MKSQNVLGVLGVAAATMAFTLTVFGPWSTGVSSDAKSIKPRVVQQKFTSHGCQFSLKTEKPEYRAGESPVVELTATNPTDKPVDTKVWVNLLVSDVPSPLSRVLAIPQPKWWNLWHVNLKPGETKTTKLTSDVKLAAKQDVTITMSDKQRTVLVKELPVRRGEPVAKVAAK